MKIKRFLIVISIFIIATVIGWLVARYIIFPQEDKISYGINEGITEVIAENHKAIKIFLPTDDRVVEEVVYVGEKVLPVEIVEISIKEYIKRFQNGLINTELLGVYIDRSNNVYLDFSGNIRSDLKGDTKREYLFLKGLYKTISNNISDVEDIKILVDGKESDTICGHLYILYGLKYGIGIDE